MEVDTLNGPHGTGPIHVPVSTQITSVKGNSQTFAEADEKKNYFGSYGTSSRRAQSSQRVEDIYEAVTDDQRCRKLDGVDAAKICPLTKRIQLLTNKTNIGKNFGYAVEGKIYLCPEEVLYFLEIHKLQVFLGKVAISIQRARSIFLNSVNDREGSTFDGTTCGFDEYTVFKNLMQHGYRPRRSQQVLLRLGKLPPTDCHGNGDDEEDAEMENCSPNPSFEFAGDIVAAESSLVDPDAKLGKRKLLTIEKGAGKRPKLYTIEEEGIEMDNGHDVSLDGGESPEIICDFQSRRTEDPETVLLDSSLSSSSTSSSSDEPVPSTSRGIESYTVTEVDSDVEFVDEIVHGGVEIEEIDGSECAEFSEDDEVPDIEEYNDNNSARISSGSAMKMDSHVLVDLVSSEDDDDSERNLKKFSATIWSQLVPHAKTRFDLPPQELLPAGISRPDKERRDYQTHGTSADICDVDLEEIVDNLRIDADPYEPGRNHAKSWGDWRSQQTSQAFNVFNNSIFGSPSIDSQQPNAHEKLNLWDTGSKISSVKHPREAFLRKYKFDLYPPTENKLARSKLERPAYRVIIARETEELPNLEALGYSVDQIPFLIAVVNEDQDVTYLSPGSGSIPNLFNPS